MGQTDEDRRFHTRAVGVSKRWEMKGWESLPSSDEPFVLAIEQDDSRSDPYFAIVFTTPRIIDGTQIFPPSHFHSSILRLISCGIFCLHRSGPSPWRRILRRSIYVSHPSRRAGSSACRWWCEEWRRWQSTRRIGSRLAQKPAQMIHQGSGPPLHVILS